MWRMLLPCGKLIGLLSFCLLFLLSILFLVKVWTSSIWDDADANVSIDPYQEFIYSREPHPSHK